jgi:hypothetical protein
MRRFETEQHKRDCLQSFYAGMTPLKYAYSGSAARTHDKLGNSEEYHSVVSSPSFESMALLEWLKSERSTNALKWIEIGPGNGVHAIRFWRQFQKSVDVREVMLLDFSEVLLRLATARLRKTFTAGKRIKFLRRIWDFEMGPTNLIKQYLSGSPGIVVLFGNTIGNVEDLKKTFGHLRASLLPCSKLCLTWAGDLGDVDPERYLEPYRTSIFTQAALEPLRMLGLNVTDARLRLEFNKTAKSVECYYDLMPNEIPAGSDILVDKMTTRSIRCFQSRRLSEERFRQTAQSAGFAVDVAVWNSTDNVFLAILH